MNLIEALLLGLVQGLTEFIPVSSSGHLIIAHHFLGASVGGLTFDIALHIGTLLALVIFFYKDIWQLAKALVRTGERTRLAWLIVLATVPAVIAGMLVEDYAEDSFRSVRLVSVTLIIVALLMLLAERVARKTEAKAGLEKISRRQAIMVGCAQAVALIPGVSRSGSTITAGLLAGLDRVAATRFSFLLAIPITFGAILKIALQDTSLQAFNQELNIFLVGIMAAFLSGLFAIKFLLRFLAGHGLHVFAYYRLALGLVVLAVSFL